MKTIKNILFDLGGVLIDIDFNRPVEAFGKLGFPHFEKHYSQLTASELFLQLEKGQINEEQFYRQLQTLGPGHIPQESLQTAWNSILLGFREKSLTLLSQLKTQYRLFLLSNTNAIHHQAFSAMYHLENPGKNLDDLFEKTYYSHQIGERKPESSAFNYVIHDAGIHPEETLFIDDTHENIEAAGALGFQTIWLQKDQTIEEWEKRDWAI